MSQIILPRQMDYDLIDVTPIRPGWGRIWQGGAITSEEVYGIPGPLVIICVNRPDIDEHCINNKEIHGVLSLWIDDIPSATIKDHVYIGLIEAAVGLLKRGINLYIHCRCGISRSTYITMGIYMRLGLSFKEALSRITSQRKDAFPNWGFYDHLKSLEKKLNDLNTTENKIII